MNRILSSIALAAALTLGCGSPTQKTTNSGNTNTMNPNSNPNVVFTPNNGTSTDIEGRLWSAICDAVFNCDNVQPELALVVGRFRNAQDCQATGEFPGLDLDSAQLDASIADGRASWNATKAEECFAAVRQQLCNGQGLFENVPACDEVLTGLVPEGGACAASDECADNRDCSTADQCYGTCVPNCGENNCTDAETCDFNDNTCKPRGAGGAMCDWTPDCQPGLECNDSGVCAATGTAAAGQACSAARDCQTGLACSNDVCTEIQLLNSGQACTFTATGTTAFCKPGTVCTNLVVDGEMLTGTCSPPQPEGGACRLSFECEWGLTCDAASPLEIGACVPAKADGQPCTEDAGCQSYDCSNDVCTARSDSMVCELP